MTHYKVIVIGGGFAGLNTVRSLRKAKCDILLIDKSNHHTFQPLLYQVATAALSPGNIATPLREILRNQANTTVIMANVVGIDVVKKNVQTSDGETFSYDYLIVAPGARHHYFGHPEWENLAPGLKTLRDALKIREDLLLTFEMAERSEDPDWEKFLRFAIIGGGPTGVEMAGSIAEIARTSMYKNFRKIKPELTKVYLVEGEKRILGSYTPDLSEKAMQDLEKMGVQIILNKRVTNITAEGIWFGDELLPVSKTVWAAGNQASPLLQSLGVPLDRQGRVLVEKDLSIPGHPELFVLGDAAHFLDGKGQTLPGIAPVAVQQGRYVAGIIERHLPSERRQPFYYNDKGQIATIGKAKAVAMMGRAHFSGYFAWLIWSLVHIWYLISFSNRLIVMIQWMFWYLTGQRNVRLILKDLGDK